jgi:hypothetical protein
MLYSDSAALGGAVAAGALTYFDATLAVSSPKRTRASVAIDLASESVASADQVFRAFAVSPPAW